VPILYSEAGGIEFLHYDFYAQALAKIERGHRQDVDDVAMMFRSSLVDAARLRQLFDEVVPALDRYPAIDAGAFREKLETAIARAEAAEES